MIDETRFICYVQNVELRFLCSGGESGSSRRHSTLFKQLISVLPGVRAEGNFYWIEGPEAMKKN
jgi:hypothetical protein